jgi:MFS family permease
VTRENRHLPVRLRRARVAVSAVFFVHGAVFASWAARVPAVRDTLHLSPGVLGLVLAGPGLGALAGSQAGGLLVRRFGGRAVSAAAPVVLCVPLGAVPLAHSAGPLTAVLVALGMADGCTAVAMNAQAVAVQRRYGRAVMNSMHAVRSIGAVAGGLAGVATAAVGLPLTAQFVVTGAGLALVSAAAACGLLPPSAEDRPARAATRLFGRGAGRRRGDGPAVALLALMTFLAALVEDTPASWSGVYLRELGAGDEQAGGGYSAIAAGGGGARGARGGVGGRGGGGARGRGKLLVTTLAIVRPSARPPVRPVYFPP